MISSELPLIPRATLFGNPERGSCQISPDGHRLAFLAPKNGVMNLWVCEIGLDPAAALESATCVTDERARGIPEFHWAYDGIHLLYLQDANGDENTHVFSVPFSGGTARDLTPFPGARAFLQHVSRQRPASVLVSLNDRDPRYGDLHELDLATGELTLVATNPGFFGFVNDDRYRVVLAVEPRPDGSRVLVRPDGDEWKPWRVIAESDSNTWPLGVSEDGHTLYMLDSRGRDTAALVGYDLSADGESGTVIATHDRADISGIWEDLRSHEPLAWFANVERREIHVLSDRIAAHVAFLDTQGLGEWSVASRSDDDGRWIVMAATDVSPVSFHFYEVATHRLHKLYEARPLLSQARLAHMQHTTLQSRDGLPLVTYLTLPPHAERRIGSMPGSRPVPLVLLVHGGPQLRDYWGYNPMHQWLANRGYAVLSVNYRGSTGYGKAFVAAGDGEWGGRMDDDLVDAIRWAIERQVADPERICIMGGSYGGYACLWSLTANLELYACGIDIVGPANLETLAASIPPYWEAAKRVFFKMIGDPATPEGRALMQARSPVHQAAKIRSPLLIGHGANDPRVKKAESDQMVAALKSNHVPVTYVVFPDEGHGFGRPANSIRFNAIVEDFLAKTLGGRSEPLSPGEVDGNTAMIVEDSTSQDHEEAQPGT